MSKNGPILIVEDDVDDQQMLTEVLNSLKLRNELKYFQTAPEALIYLDTTEDKPFIILSDVNLPGMTGPDLKKKINSTDKLRRKSIPFVFLTTSANPAAVVEAYELMVQGYFQKPNKMADYRAMVKMIIDYWMVCKSIE